MAGGLFITFEGGEGSGKSTQIRLLKKTLEKRGHHVIVTREPGGTHIADQIRSILLDRNNKEMIPLTELFLYEASRAQHVAEVIRPHLKKGNIVISDRYADATTVYQGYARGLPSEQIRLLNSIATSGDATQPLKPDLTILLDCPIRLGFGRLRRLHKRLDRIEQEKRIFHERIRRGYLKIAKKEPKRVKVINGTRDPQEVHHDILKLVIKKMDSKSIPGAPVSGEPVNK